MKDITKNRIRLYIIALIIVLMQIVMIWISTKFAAEPYKLETIQVGQYQAKTFSGHNFKDEYLPLVHVYWRKDKLLTAGDVIKLLKKSGNGCAWTARYDDSDYARWRRSDNKMGATHRKKDGRMLIYTKGFAAWHNKNKQKHAKLIYRIMQ